MSETKTETKKATPVKKSKTLAEALAAFQADLPQVDLDSVNPHFKSKFASLANITKKVLPELSKHGFSYSVGSFVDNGLLVVDAHLIHESGESRSFQFPITETQPQKIGSAITYAKRYAIQALTGVVADEDDDGNAASQQPPAALAKAKDRAAAAPPRPRQAASGSQQKIVSEFIEPGKASREQVNDLTNRVKTEKGLKGEELFAEVLKALQNGEVG